MNDKLSELLDLAKQLADGDTDDPSALEAMMEQLSSDTFDELNTEDIPEPKVFSLVRAPKVSLTDLSPDDLSTVHNGSTLLFPAVQSGDISRVDFFLDRGFDIDQQNDNGWTPLITAISTSTEPNRAIARHLINRGANLELGSEYSETPFRLSVHNGDYDIAQFILDQGVDWQSVGFTPLHQAAAKGDLDAIAQLAPESDLEAHDTWQQTPWFTAICANQPDAAKKLAELGADTSATSHADRPAIHRAAETRATRSIKYLLKNGIAPNTRDDFGNTPLHQAAAYGNLDTAKTLVEAGADVCAENSVQVQPISDASSIELLEFLINKGADINFVDGCGYWPLKSAAENDDLKRIQWLLSNGANPNTTSTGDIALHKAVTCSSLLVVKALIEAGSDIHAQDVDGDSILFPCQSVDIARYLVEKGADVSLLNCCGETAAEASYVAPEVRAYLSSLRH